MLQSQKDGIKKKRLKVENNVMVEYINSLKEQSSIPGNHSQATFNSNDPKN